MLSFLFILSAIIIYSVSPAALPDAPCICMSFGDVHYVTDDFQWTNFHGLCRYTILSSEYGREQGCDFKVDVENDRHDRRNLNTSGRIVYVAVGRRSIVMGPGLRLQVESAVVYPPYSDSFFRISYYGGYLELTTGSCYLKVAWNGYHIVAVTVPAELRGKTSGICGNCDGRSNDQLTKDGTDVSQQPNWPQLIGNSYLVADEIANTKCLSTEERVCENPTHSSRCNIIKDENGPFAECASANFLDAYFSACNYDMCRDANVFDSSCIAIEAFAARCRMGGYPAKWRGAASCPLSCPEKAVYKSVIEQCPATCAVHYPQECLQDGRDGCECTNDYVWSGTSCQPTSKCGCLDDVGHYFELGADKQVEKCGEIFTCKRDSNHHPLFELKMPKKVCPPNAICKEEGGDRVCSCREGFQLHEGSCMTESQVEAAKKAAEEREKALNEARERAKAQAVETHYYDEKTEHDIREEGLTVHGDTEAHRSHRQCNDSQLFEDENSCLCCVDGDSYLRTFDHQIVDAKGLCTYTLATLGNETEQCHFDVDMKTSLMVEEGVTYNIVRSMELHLLGYKVFLNSSSGIKFDSLSNGSPGGSVSDFNVAEKGGFYVLKSPRCGITVASNGHQVFIVIPKSYAKQTRGLCGDCDGNKNDLITRHREDLNKAKDRKAAQKLFLQSYIVLKTEKKDFCSDEYRSMMDCTNAIQEDLYDESCEYLKQDNNAFKKCFDYFTEYESDFLDVRFGYCKVSACRGLHNEQPRGPEDLHVSEGTVCQYLEELVDKCESVQPVDDSKWRMDTNCWQNLTSLGFHHDAEDTDHHH